MANDAFGALLSGLASAAGTWGKAEWDDKQNAKLAARKAALNLQEADLKAKADEARLLAEQRRKLPSYTTIEVDGPNGRTIKRVIEQGYDRETGEPYSRPIGESTKPLDAPKIESFREGDQTVSKQWDPQTGQYIEVGRGPAFAPKGRGGTDGDGGSGSGRATNSDAMPGTFVDEQGIERPVGKAADWEIIDGVRVNKLYGAPKPIPGYEAAVKSKKEAEAQGKEAENILEKARGAREQLAILDQMEKLLPETSTGPLDQYTGGALSLAPWQASPKNQQRFDTLAKQLVGPTIKSMFGSANLSEGDRKSAEAALPNLGKYEDVNRDVIAQLRAQAQKALANADALKQATGKYSVGQIIEQGGKKYRVTGGDPNDPDVEEVK